jgi:DNA-binding CsgD family transcriptional regulator
MALATGQQDDRPGGHRALAELEAAGSSHFQLMEVEIERGQAWVAVASGELGNAVERLQRAATQASQRGQHALEAGALHDLVRLQPAGRQLVSVSRRLAELASELTGELTPARAVHAEAAASLNPARAVDASEQFEAAGALLWAAEAASTAANLAERAGLSRRAAESRRRSGRLLEQCEGAATPALRRAGQPDPLSRREREVATLAARGLSSRDIAARLFLSTRTVDNHLQRAYQKLGVDSRTALGEVLK